MSAQPVNTYIPIGQLPPPALQDTVISIKKEPFTSAPPLQFLDAYNETVIASAPYFDPANPKLSSAGTVTYRVSRQITTLSERVVELRHLGSAIDMEVYVDNYSYIQAEPFITTYTPSPTLPKIQKGDRYERQTLCYVFANIPVPKSSSKVWDGRYSKCVNKSGEEVSHTSYLPALRQEVFSILSSPSNSPYTVVSTGGFANTIRPPTTDPYASHYRLKIDEFIAVNYNSISLPSPPTADSAVVKEVSYYPDKAPNGTGHYKLVERVIAALLEGPYFIDWVRYSRYEEVLDDSATHPTLEDVYARVEGQEEDGDSIVSIQAFN